jgi:hypothetical protein
MIANTTMMIKGYEICIDDMEPGDLEIVQGWSEKLLSSLQVVDLKVGRKTYRVVPGFISLVNSKLDSIGSATRAREAGRSAKIGKSLMELIQESLGCDREGARATIRTIRSMR